MISTDKGVGRLVEAGSNEIPGIRKGMFALSTQSLEVNKQREDITGVFGEDRKSVV